MDVNKIILTKETIDFILNKRKAYNMTAYQLSVAANRVNIGGLISKMKE